MSLLVTLPESICIWTQNVGQGEWDHDGKLRFLLEPREIFCKYSKLTLRINIRYSLADPGHVHD